MDDFRISRRAPAEPVQRVGGVSPARDHRRSRTRRKVVRTVAIAGSLFASLAMMPMNPPVSASDPLVTFGPSDAESIQVFSGAFDQSGGPGTPFWWDHTNLTVAVSAAPRADPQLVDAIHDAIATWRDVLAAEIPTISLADVTNAAGPRSRADIIVHYVPKAGGFSWGGTAVCGYQHCANVLVRSDLVGLDQTRNGEPDFDATRVYRMALHEIGHALGLGHATPLETSLDIMGYGWALPDPDLTPIISDCDLAGIAATFAWALDSESPHPATVSSVTC